MFIKRKKTILFITVFILMIYSFIPEFAIEKANIYLTTNKDNFEKNEEIKLTVGIEDNRVAAYNFEIYFDTNKIDFVSSSEETTNLKDGKIISVWYDESGGKNGKEKDLENYVFKAKENGIVNFIIEGEFYNSSGQLIKTNFEQKKVTIGNEENIKTEFQEKSILQREIEQEEGNSDVKSNANLQLMRISEEGLTPSFDKNIYEYYLTVSKDISNLEVACVTENPKATVEISGNDNLKEGLNVIEVMVTSEDKKQSKLYKIEVTKTDDLEFANANLQTLALENVFLNTEFDNNIINYTAEVSNNINDIKVLAIPENEKASVILSGGNNLKEGENLIEVTVTAANGFTKKRFKIKVHKRNSIEEAEYKEEQSNLQEKLEEAYKIEKTSSNINQKNIFDNEEIEEKRNSVEVGTYIILIMGVLVGTIIYIRLKKNKKTR